MLYSFKLFQNPILQIGNADLKINNVNTFTFDEIAV